MDTRRELVGFYPSPRSPRRTRPRSSGDRATASGAVCAGSNPAGGTPEKLLTCRNTGREFLRSRQNTHGLLAVSLSERYTDFRALLQTRFRSSKALHQGPVGDTRHQIPTVPRTSGTGATFARKPHATCLNVPKSTPKRTRSDGSLPFPPECPLLRSRAACAIEHTTDVRGPLAGLQAAETFGDVGKEAVTAEMGR